MAEGSNSRGRARVFLLGGAVGASAVLAASRRRRRRRRPTGLRAFESAPCFVDDEGTRAEKSSLL